MASELFSNARKIAGVINGELEGVDRRPIRDVQVDSRFCSRDSLFVALHGDQTDGHLFLEDAFRRGSSLSFVSRHFGAKHRGKIASLCERYGTAVLVVENTLTALQLLARDHLESLPVLTTIGITGSNGKTTTKDLLGAMLSRHDETAISPGNFNSDIGLPLACFAVTPKHRYAVFEMGMNRKGEIDELVSIVKPVVSAITNIGTAHIGMLGSQEAIAREKREVFRHVCENGRGFLGEDEPFRNLLIEGVEGCVQSFGVHTVDGFGGAIDLGINGTRINFAGADVVLPLPGNHNLQNALCATAMAQWFGVASDQIRYALANARPRFGRGQIMRGRATLLLDCYNANRLSMIRAIEMLDSVSTTGRKILILGSMLELGEHSVPEHREVGLAASSSTADVALFVGEETEVAYAEVVAAGRVKAEYYPDVDALIRKAAESVNDGDTVLIKGSRSLELERLVSVIDPTLEVEE